MNPDVQLPAKNPSTDRPERAPCRVTRNYEGRLSAEEFVLNLIKAHLQTV